MPLDTRRSNPPTLRPPQINADNAVELLDRDELDRSGRGARNPAQPRGADRHAKRYGTEGVRELARSCRPRDEARAEVVFDLRLHWPPRASDLIATPEMRHIAETRDRCQQAGPALEQRPSSPPQGCDGASTASRACSVKSASFDRSARQMAVADASTSVTQSPDAAGQDRGVEAPANPQHLPHNHAG